ncbi:polymerization and export protein [Lactobacillus jensenii]|jgi:polymerization and export protein|uniref:Polymerization and export protein n=7 Tax=Lactobacillus jensenii TaxID=109790 RepID=A0A5N1I8S8_LACJE|nr:hypothetical protein [Lactobacillus jensenii]EEQ68070.1 hypothetical protein LBJG_00498 [Lactobacillus jensenii 1153]EEQ23988.1 hypothetical protein LACJE0001_1523 [Lactobacillus jensenii 269-3]KAA9257534.1 polymerization and export protein [Lactobacillus jensenii]KAA9319896.1 polymerization and export protein [Lactobacillus jensenii]KAA9321486.1 polymerization and export protein [Lactobacillus jensenii]
MKPKKIFLNLLNYCIASFILLNANTVYIHSNPKVYQICQMIFPIICLFFIFISFCFNDFKIDYMFFFGIGVSLYILMWVLYQIAFLGGNRTSLLIPINFCLIFLLIWTQIKKNNLIQLTNAYVNLVVIVAAISIVFWLLTNIFHKLIPSNYVLLYWGYERFIPNYHNLYFETQQWGDIFRNTAIFTEAPMAALNFLVALAFNMIFLNKTKLAKFKSFILIIAGLMTISTTMYIGILALLIYRFFEKTARANKYISLIKFIFIIILFVISAVIVNSLINSKLQTGSGIDRSSDYINGINAWINHPIMGNGLNAGINEGTTIINGEVIGHYGFSSSFSQLLGDSGLFLVVPIFLSILETIRKSIFIKEWKILILSILFMYLVFVSIFTTTYLFMYLLIFIVMWNFSDISELNRKAHLE